LAPVPARALIALGLAAATLAVYQEVRHHEFVSFDDDYYIVDNAALREGLTGASLLRAFTTPYATNWTPLTSISYQIDFALYGLDARGYLLTNAVLHALAAALLFAALERLTGALGRSAFVAAVFALHPLHVESVAWASERKDVLSGVFFALALLGYARYAERTGSRARLLLVALALALGLLAKPMLVTLPFVLLLLDWWPLGRLRRGEARRCLVEKLPLLALAAAAAAITYLVQSGQGAMPGNPPPLPDRARNALHAAGAYLGQTFWPAGLAVFYPYPPSQGSQVRLAAELALLLGISAVALALARSRGYLLVGWLWYLGMLVPVSGLVQVGLQARADRYTYLPQVGIAIALAWGACDLAARGAAGRRALAALGVLCVAALAVATRVQLGHWRDTRALFEHAAAVTAGNYLAYKVLGDEAMRDGDPEAALRLYSQSLFLKPDYAETHLELARLHGGRGRPQEAIRHYRYALRGRSDDQRARIGLAKELLGVRSFEAAREQLEIAAAAEPDNAGLRSDLAVAQLALGDLEAAARSGREAVRLDPDLASAVNGLAWLLATAPDPALRSPEEAVRLAERASRSPGGETAAFLHTLAASYAAAGRFSDAVATAERALALAEERGEPVVAGALRHGLSLYREGRPFVDEALSKRNGD
jgi:tetratricopeptide (TPR) repeat protein